MRLVVLNIIRAWRTCLFDERVEFRKEKGCFEVFLLFSCNQTKLLCDQGCQVGICKAKFQKFGNLAFSEVVWQ